MANETRITHAGAYVEIDPADTLRITHAGAYVEVDPADVMRITHAGAYVEILVPWPETPGYRVRPGHNRWLGSQHNLNPQPRSPGVMYTRRLPSGNDGVWDEGAFVPLEWNVLAGSTMYQAVIAQFGLDAAKVVAVTIVARDEVWNWARFNGYAVQPLPGDDIAWERFFPQGVAIIVKELELIEVYE